MKRLYLTAFVFLMFSVVSDLYCPPKRPRSDTVVGGGSLGLGLGNNESGDDGEATGGGIFYVGDLPADGSAFGAGDDNAETSGLLGGGDQGDGPGRAGRSTGRPLCGLWWLVSQALPTKEQFLNFMNCVSCFGDGRDDD